MENTSVLHWINETPELRQRWAGVVAQLPVPILDHLRQPTKENRHQALMQAIVWLCEHINEYSTIPIWFFAPLPMTENDLVYRLLDLDQMPSNQSAYQEIKEQWQALMGKT